MPSWTRLLAIAMLVVAAGACCPVPLAGSGTGTDPATGVIGTVLAHDRDVTWLQLDGGPRLAVRPPLDFEPGTSVYVVGSLAADGTLQAASARPVLTAGGDGAPND